MLYTSKSVYFNDICNDVLDVNEKKEFCYKPDGLLVSRAVVIVALPASGVAIKCPLKWDFKRPLIYLLCKILKLRDFSRKSKISSNLLIRRSPRTIRNAKLFQRVYNSWDTFNTLQICAWHSRWKLNHDIFRSFSSERSYGKPVSLSPIPKLSN